jgi:hypothetical protein
MAVTPTRTLAVMWNRFALTVVCSLVASSVFADPQQASSNVSDPSKFMPAGPIFFEGAKAVCEKHGLVVTGAIVDNVAGYKCVARDDPDYQAGERYLQRLRDEAQSKCPKGTVADLKTFPNNDRKYVCVSPSEVTNK